MFGGFNFGNGVNSNQWCARAPGGDLRAPCTGRMNFKGHVVGIFLGFPADVGFSPNRFRRTVASELDPLLTMGKPKKFLTQAKKKGKEKNKSTRRPGRNGAQEMPPKSDFTPLFSPHASNVFQSARFFVRAIENYDVALEIYPDSFDIAYNNNTAQVLTSLAEVLSEGRRSAPESKDEALGLLEEAVELFQRCLTLQEYQFSESQAQMEGVADATEQNTQQIQDGDALMGDATSTAASSVEATEDERWATIVEPVSLDTLLDTSLAQLGALAALCGLAISEAGSGLAWIEEYSANLIQNKISAIAKSTDRQKEVALAKANFMCALADVCFRKGQMNPQTYERELYMAFSNEELGDITNDPEALGAKADALMAFCSAVVDHISDQKFDAGILNNLNLVRWNQLTMALDSLAMASKLPDAKDVAKIHLVRGDVELLRFRLGQSPNNYEPAQKNSETLLKNAGVYYRGAAGVARNEGMVEEATEAAVKETVVKGLSGDELALVALKRLLKDDREMLEEMVEEGFLDREWAERVGN
ncbi:hypothetical protein FGG08_005796 [Glutinoglossum americanum]|uniref:Uncharacterized protein n=1 Tax=Glutinoglossum americanum TaxID=1670608 RepID=A0A9P8HTV6_9PEZI|nr:hypothetical protein FGG08_005796 [Glutinoglossum americanum]